MLIPIISITKACPLNCSYCYIHHKTKHIMDMELLKTFIDSLFVHNKSDNISIIWHGGEPLIAGVDYFEEICSYIKFNFPDIKVIHRLQTSAWPINDEWAHFFKKNDFRIGVSIDGPQEVHDIHRTTINNQPTFNQVYSHVKLLEDYGLKLGFNAVATKKTKKYVKEVFNFFKSNNWTYAFAYASVDTESDYYMSSEECVKYYESVLLNFLSQKEKYIKVQPISHNIYSILNGKSIGLCTNQPNCADEYISITADGNIYNCNRFSDFQTESYGNLKFEKLNDILKSDKRKQFYLRQKKIKSMCEKCEFLKLCNGGCPHSDYVSSKNIYSKKIECDINKGVFTLLLNYLRKELL